MNIDNNLPHEIFKELESALSSLDESAEKWWTMAKKKQELEQELPILRAAKAAQLFTQYSAGLMRSGLVDHVRGIWFSKQLAAPADGASYYLCGDTSGRSSKLKSAQYLELGEKGSLLFTDRLVTERQDVQCQKQVVWSPDSPETLNFPEGLVRKIGVKGLLEWLTPNDWMINAIQKQEKLLRSACPDLEQELAELSARLEALKKI